MARGAAHEDGGTVRLRQVGQGKPGEVDGGREIGGDGACDLLAVELKQGAGGQDAGVVDEDVDGSKRSVGSLDHLQAGGGVGHVTLGDGGLAPQRLHLAGHRCKRLPAAAAKDDGGATAGKRKRNAAANASPRAGDESGPAAEVAFSHT